MGTTSSAADRVRLQILREGSERSEDVYLSHPGCEGEDVRQLHS